MGKGAFAHHHALGVFYGRFQRPAAEGVDPEFVDFRADGFGVCGLDIVQHLVEAVAGGLLSGLALHQQEIVGDGRASAGRFFMIPWAVAGGAKARAGTGEVEPIDGYLALFEIRRARASASLALSVVVIPEDFEIRSSRATMESEFSELIERLRALLCRHCSL